MASRARRPSPFTISCIYDSSRPDRSPRPDPSRPSLAKGVGGADRLSSCPGHARCCHRSVRIGQERVPARARPARSDRRRRPALARRTGCARIDHALPPRRRLSAPAPCRLRRRQRRGSAALPVFAGRLWRPALRSRPRGRARDPRRPRRRFSRPGRQRTVGRRGADRRAAARAAARTRGAAARRTDRRARSRIGARGRDAGDGHGSRPRPRRAPICGSRTIRRRRPESARAR